MLSNVIKEQKQMHVTLYFMANANLLSNLLDNIAAQEQAIHTTFYNP